MWTSVVTAVSNATASDWLLLIGTLMLLLYAWGTWTYDYFQKRGIHFLKPKFPFIGNMTSAFLGTSSFPEMIENLYVNGKGHGVLGLFEFRTPVLMVRDPEVLKIIAIKDFDHIMNRRTLDCENVEPFFVKNLSNLKGDQWRRMRATLSPAFTTSKIKGMFPLISQCATQLTEHLHITYAESRYGCIKTPMEIDMKDIFGRTATDIIGSVAFGVQCDSLKERENEFYMMGRAISSFTLFQNLVFVALMVAPKLLEILGIRFLNARAVNFFDSLVHETIRERKKKGIFRPDMLQLLMQAQQGNLKAEPQDGGEEEKLKSWRSNLEVDEISAQAIMFFFAGFDSISNGLCFTVYALSVHQDVQKKLQEEIDEVFQATNGKPTYGTVQGMKYLDAVINETLRLYPNIPAFDRQCNEDTVLPASENNEAIRISKGTIFCIPTVGIHHDPEYWPDPMTFNPDRFSDDNRNNIKPFSYLPFGGGPRMCIAQRFALIEMKIVILHLLRTFNLHRSPKVKYPMEYKNGFVISPKGGFLCCIQPRE